MKILEEKQKISEALFSNEPVQVVTYGGKISGYSWKEIQEMVDNEQKYQEADNLPKWIFVSATVKKSPGMREALRAVVGTNNVTFALVFEFLRLLEEGTERMVIINVRSDRDEDNGVMFL